MDKFITPESIALCLGVLGAIYLGLSIAVLVKKLFARSDRESPVTRAEYEKDDAARKEQLARMEAQCDRVEAASTRRHDDHLSELKELIESLNRLKVEVASLTGHLRSSCPGGAACQTHSSPLPPSSSLRPKAAT